MARLHTNPMAAWGNHPRQTCHAARPETWQTLEDSVRSDAISSICPRGLGRSYGDAALNEDAGLVLMERLDRCVGFDEETGVLEAEAGLSIAAIIEAFLPRGWFPAVTPGTRFVTLGGAIAADVHGKNHHAAGAFANCTEAIELLLPSGEAVWCSRETDPELFFATLGGMGLTGVIRRCRVRLRRVESAYIDARYERAPNLDSAFDAFESRFNNMTYAVAWIDCLARGKKAGRSVLIGGEHASAGGAPASSRSPLALPRPRTKSVPFDFPGFALNPLSVGAFNAAYYRAPRPSARTEPLSGFFYPLDAISGWNRVYGKRGFQQYQVVVPFEGGKEAIRTLLDRISRSRRASFLAVLKSMGAESGGPLSFPMPGWTLALDLPQSAGLDALLRELDAISLDFGGRRYLAKDASLSPEHLGRMYPRLDEFRAVRTRVDPERRISSSLSRRLGIDA